MKVYFFGVESWEKLHIERMIKELNLNIDYKLYETALNEVDINEIKDAEILNVFIYSEIDKKVIDSLPNLKMIITRSASYDHIDVEYAKQKGIVVSHIPDYGNNTVAEFVFAMILALARKLKPLIEKIHKHEFDRYSLLGMDLMGKTIGLVGAGNIGSHIARIAHGFGMNILAYDKNKREDLVQKYGVKYVGLEDLLREADIISVQLPYNKSTKYLINRFNIKLTKMKAMLINVSRGQVVELEAIVEALKEGRLAGGVAIDTIEDELQEEELRKKDITPVKLKKLVEEFYVLNEDNVILSPHLAYYTKDALERLIDLSLEEIKRFIENKPLKYAI